MADYIPIKDEAFLDWARNLTAYAAAHYSPWNIPDPAAALQAPLAVYAAAFEAALNPNRGRVDVLAKNDAKKRLKSAIRVYVKAYLINNPAVRDEERAAMGLPIHKTTKTPVPVPHTAPQLFVDTGTRRRLSVTYRDEGSSTRGKPAGVRGIEVRWAIRDAAPADIGKELMNSAFDTKPPLVIDFGEQDRGKKVFLCGRWEIEREGEKGPFGDIEEAIVP
jgi:hypothetical protein